MARKSDGARPVPDPRRERPQVFPFVALLACVVGTLLLGGALRDESPPAPVVSVPQGDFGGDAAAAIDPPRALEAPAPPPPGLDAVATPEPAVGPSPMDRLAARAANDLERLAARPSGWTAQLALLCDVDRVESLVADVGDAGELHVLPTYHEGRPCFRLCWGRYGTKEAALAATDLPAALRRLAATPYPRPIEGIFE